VCMVGGVEAGERDGEVRLDERRLAAR